MSSFCRIVDVNCLVVVLESCVRAEVRVVTAVCARRCGLFDKSLIKKFNPNSLL